MHTVCLEAAIAHCMLGGSHCTLYFWRQPLHTVCLRAATAHCMFGGSNVHCMFGGSHAHCMFEGSHAHCMFDGRHAHCMFEGSHAHCKPLRDSQHTACSGHEPSRRSSDQGIHLELGELGFEQRTPCQTPDVRGFYQDCLTGCRRIAKG